jgi:hypothetical protein
VQDRTDAQRRMTRAIPIVAAPSTPNKTVVPQPLKQ